MTTKALLVSILFIAACRTTPPGPPSQVGTDIVLALDEGRAADADRLFERSAQYRDHSDRIYPVLFESAHGRYTTGDFAGAAALLGFMGEHYPASAAVREAQLYALFLRRSQEGNADARLGAELDVTLDRVLSDNSAPTWAHLVAAQHAIDRGDPERARSSLESFRARWDGAPASLLPYVEELERYLTTH